MLSDVRYALRQFARFPGFTATIVATLALGIGACTVVFTTVKTTLLEIIQGSDFSRTVLIHEQQLPARPQLQVSAPMYLELEREAKTLRAISAYYPQYMDLTGDFEPQRLRIAFVNAHTFSVLGSPIALGRSFEPDEFTTGKDRVVILSHATWQQTFGGSPDVLNRQLRFDGNVYTVVGVASEKFDHFGSGLAAFFPLVFDDAIRQQWGARFLQVTAQLQPDATVEQARAELDLIARRVAEEQVKTNKGGGLLVRPFSTYLNRTLSPMLNTLLATVICVLAVACGNVANLLLVRATARQQELSIRTALGAGRARLVRQLLIESVLLSLLGGLLGIAIAYAGLKFVRTFAPAAGTDFARLAYVHLDGRMLLFTLGFSVLTGLIFGLAPAWLSSRVNLNEALKQGGRGSSEARGRGRLRRVIAMAEIALAMVLISMAGLLIRSFVQLAQIDPGFEASHAASMLLRLRPDQYRTNEQRIALTDSLLARLRGLPFVESAGLTSSLPTDALPRISFTIAGQPPPPPGAELTILVNRADSDYFRPMRIRLLEGRTFDDRDTDKTPPVIVVNQTFARHYFPNQSALGQRIDFGNGAVLIVGVVSDIIQGALGEPTQPGLYFPWRQSPPLWVAAVVRTKGDPAPVFRELREQVFAIDKTQPVDSVGTLENAIGNMLARQRLMLQVLVVFAALGLAISAVGLYGVMAYSVSRRTNEFGVRVALGATPAHILRSVLREGMLIVAAGIAFGLLVALALGRLVAAYLYNTTAHDAGTLVATILVLSLAALIACLIPALRATRINPTVALRAE